ncbi:hypothetical protein AB1N83_012780 [Pleurotus pulmonarius]
MSDRRPLTKYPEGSPCFNVSRVSLARRWLIIGCWCATVESENSHGLLYSAKSSCRRSRSTSDLTATCARLAANTVHRAFKVLLQASLDQPPPCK